MQKTFISFLINLENKNDLDEYIQSSIQYFFHNLLYRHVSAITDYFNIDTR